MQAWKRDASRYAILKAVVEVARYFGCDPRECKGMTLRQVLEAVDDCSGMGVVASNTWTEASLDTGI